MKAQLDGALVSVQLLSSPDGVANDEAADDEDEHLCDGVIATLVRRDGVVTLRRAADLAEDEAVEDEQHDHREEDERDGVGDEDVVARVRLVHPELGVQERRHHDLLGRVGSVVQVVAGHVDRPHLGPELEKPRDVEEQRADDDGERVHQVVVLAEEARLERDNEGVEHISLNGLFIAKKSCTLTLIKKYFCCQ